MKEIRRTLPDLIDKVKDEMQESSDYEVNQGKINNGKLIKKWGCD